jgi:hypothetical protein
MAALAFHIQRQIGGRSVVHAWQERQYLEFREVKQRSNQELSLSKVVTWLTVYEFFQKSTRSSYWWEHGGITGRDTRYTIKYT